MDKKYIDFITDLKQNIIQSRYIAARLANKEQLLLYFKTGKMLSEKIDAEKWGVKVMEQIAEDLQKHLPGLRGFSYRNLRNMRQFALEYSPLLNDYQQDIIWQSEYLMDFIGIVLCKEKNNTIVEFAVRSIDKAMGVATYRTTKEVPKEMQGILPDAAELARLL